MEKLEKNELKLSEEIETRFKFTGLNTILKPTFSFNNSKHISKTL